MNFSESNRYLERAKKVIPVCSQTFSKGPAYFPVGASPLFLTNGIGSHVWDVDKNEFVDWICGLGPITLGYCYPAVDNAVINQLDRGAIFSLPSPLEVELAEKLVSIVPCAEMVRFLKTGSEACQAVIRVAKAYTGKPSIAFRGYHGWHDWYAVQSERSKGISKELLGHIYEFEYNNLTSLESIFGKQDIAAVIMEPMIVEPPESRFLEQVKELCNKHGALLIFDETVTGFRWALGGAQEYFGVTPDLAVFGKGIANGLPLAAVCGKKAVMREFEDVFVSSTFGGDCLSLAASLATIEEMQRKNTIQHCWDIGAELISGLEKIGIGNKGFPCRPVLDIGEDSPEIRTLLLQELIKQGVLIHNNLFLNICYSHSLQDVKVTLKAFRIAWDNIKSGKAVLEGSIVTPAFKRL